MGLTAPFRHAADLQGIAAGIGPISQAIHRANITVDEWGTEAAAVTGIAFATGAMLPPALRFRADRPFAFAIVGGRSRTPLFAGVVGDPTAK
jgi:serpin B